MRVKSEDIRIRIVDSTKKMVSKTGLRETSISDIAKDAKVSPTTIYSYFSGKQALFEAAGIDDSMNCLNSSKSLKRQEIVEVALLSFGQKGYAKTSIESIMRKVGIGKTAFYHYFENKEALFSSVLNESLVNLTSQQLEVKKGEKDLSSILHEIGSAYMAMGNDPKRKAVFKTVVEQSESNPDFGRIYYDSGISAVSSSICKSLEPCLNRNEIQKDINLKVATLIFIMSIWAYNVNFKYICGACADFDEEDVLHTALQIFARGMTPTCP